MEFINQLNNIKERYIEFTKELMEIRDNDQFFENDIERLSTEFEQFKQEIQHINVFLQLNSIDSRNHCNKKQDELSIKSYLNSSQLLLERKIISLHDRNCFFVAASNNYILVFTIDLEVKIGHGIWFD